MKQLPNFFTLINLFFGCIAIVFTLQTESILIYTNDEFTSSFNVPEKLSYAGLFLFAAALVDFLDGFVARLCKSNSEMGKQLDSLADVVSFGVAPALILYQLLRISFAKEADGLDVSAAALLPAFLIPCAGAWRLARFNIDTTQQFSFKGIPIPAAGITIASLPLIIHYQQLNLQEILINKWLIYGIILLLSYLMVSNIPLMSLKFKDSSLKNNMPKYILAAIAIFAALVLKWVAIPVVFIAYVIVSLVFKNKIA